MIHQEIQAQDPSCHDPLSVTFRHAEPSDAKSLLMLMRKISQQTDYLLSDTDEMSIDDQRRLIEQYLQQERSAMVVVECDGQFVGMGNLVADRHPRLAHAAEIGISLVEEYWGYGIGSMLAEAMIDYARRHGIEAINLEVVSENERAIRLYRRLGFQTVGTLHRRLHQDASDYYDTLIMERLLVDN